MKKQLASKTKRIDAGKYSWEHLEGTVNPLFALLLFVGKKEVIAEVIGVDNEKNAMGEYGYQIFSGSYGTKIDHYEGGVEFEDGSCLICVGTSTWGGTFASHDNHEVRYYSLIPK
jgi:hypothetical protein